MGLDYTTTGLEGNSMENAAFPSMLKGIRFIRVFVPTDYPTKR